MTIGNVSGNDSPLITRGSSVDFAFHFATSDGTTADIDIAEVELVYVSGDGYRRQETLTLLEAGANWTGQWHSEPCAGGWVDYHAHAKKLSAASYVVDGRFKVTSANRASRQHDPLPGDHPYRAPTSGGSHASDDGSYTIAIPVEGRPNDGELLLRHEFETSVRFPAGTIRASGDVASAGTATLNITKNGALLATITFASSTEAEVPQGDLDFDTGDIMRVYAPSPRDATLADFSITMPGRVAGF